ncbi:unnamed protein product [Prunus armeniaca]|uniref:Uncharacterized protein n=1 Tax=Prunus armeniaca TaxID=36596 RepID=A0A6J5XTY3_PRUAR|nr:unnamed protein product [Prunus armeniaca]
MGQIWWCRKGGDVSQEHGPMLQVLRHRAGFVRNAATGLGTQIRLLLKSSSDDFDYIIREAPTRTHSGPPPHFSSTEAKASSASRRPESEVFCSGDMPVKGAGENSLWGFCV